MLHSTPLTPLDELMTRWPFSPGAAGLAITCQGPAPTSARITALVRERWGAIPRLSRALTPRGRPGPARRHAWVHHRDFDAAQQIVHESGTETFEQLVSRLMTEPFDQDLPPWRLHTLPEPDGSEFTLLLRTHHSLLDGRSLVTLLRTLLDATAQPPAPRTAPVRTAPPEQRALQRFASVVRALRAASVPGTAVPMPDRGATAPAYACRPVPAEVFGRARTALPGQATTVTEVFLAATAGTLRTGLSPWPSSSGGERPVFVTVPMDTRPAGHGHRLGNEFGAIRVAVPAGTDDPLARLAACRGLIKPTEHQATLRFADALLHALTAVGPRLVSAVLAPSYAPAYSAACCSSLPLPGEGLAFDGRPLRRFRGFPMVPPHGTATFVLLGCAAGYTLNVATNSCSGDARLLADTLLRELHLLAAPALAPAAHGAP
ncbi:wax ester/triacylglycerol synthase domain-containing protein [Kitasatospora sp. NPDC094011]|uniref:wax ester/triacylglycerol synthase domain-containing protein n=1 Tax=Kitasatospora sp. NPDC094011 TaxID=3364090 RepID=UPI0038175C8B